MSSRNGPPSWDLLGNGGWTIGQRATLACVLEVCAPKPGNVHRGADFDDVTFQDFLTSAVAIGPAMEDAASLGIGAAIEKAVAASRAVVASNTHLGTILLLAPLAILPAGRPARKADVARVLRGLTARDAQLVYQAIRLAAPGGLGRVDRHDVAGQPPSDLLAAMRDASGRDRVAAQYVNNFADILDVVCPELRHGRLKGWSLPTSIVHAHLTVMAMYPDSLIQRKCGPDLAREAAARAARVLDGGPPDSAAYQDGLAELDFWLRSDGHRRNPGTSADLVAAALFVLLGEEGK